MRTKVAGVDVGGTYTDLILLDEATGSVRISKVLSTPENQAFGVLAALDETTENLGSVRAVIHGTTVTTNAMLERKIARCGLITTRGFRDTLELGRRTRPDPYGMMAWFRPLIPRDRRLEVDERMDAEGRVLRCLDEDQVRSAAQALLKLGCESLVIHFLHSYVNPTHEDRAAEIVENIWPNAYVTVGHRVLTEFREYERGVTATVNAAVQPVLDRYLTELQHKLADRGYQDDLLVMQGNGGLVSSRIVVENAVNSVMSGPASGVSASAYSAATAGLSHLITYDMGGTSCDVGVVKHGVPEVSAELELEYAMPIHVPMVEVHTIGAGGGSIAYLDEAGLLQVGPESAGADPGPICYGRGGNKITISDANLLLGRLDKDRLLAVDNPVSLDVVRRAISEQIGKRLDLAPEEAAAAVLRIGNDKMAGAIRLISLARGQDPRDYTLFAFGGAGPLHAVAIARELDIPTVIIPPRPGLVNALGCLVADIRHDYVDMLNRRLEEVDISDIQEILTRQVSEGRHTIEREQVEIEEITFRHRAHMKYQGQTHELVIPIEMTELHKEQLASDFGRAYWNRFFVELPEMRPVLVSLHTTVFGRRRDIRLDTLLADEGQERSLDAARTGERQVWFETGWHLAPVLRRERLPYETKFEGPAIVEQLDSTTVIEPSDHVEIDHTGNLLIQVGGARE